jgi:MipA family protein
MFMFIASSCRLPLAVATAMVLHSAAFAHGDAGELAEGSSWGLGMAVMAESKPYRDVDNETKVVPLVTFENRWVRVLGPKLEVKLAQSGPVSFGLTASYGMDGYQASDSDFLNGMSKRSGSAWLGAQATLRSELALLTTQWTADASGHSGGQRFMLGIEHRFSLGPIGLTPRLNATWMDSDFVKYYYGVEAAEVRAGRPQYSPGSTVNTELGLRLDYRMAPQHMVFADLGGTALGSAIKSSPLVDRSSISELRLGYLYRF